ncbi:MAG: hypothetical protein JW888_02560 [Pirellulales bacterium]|nr:hypothetical protein [Pirellulales bacterium]
MSHVSPQSTQAVPSSCSPEPRLLGTARIDAPHAVANEGGTGATRDSEDHASGTTRSEDESALMQQVHAQAAQLAEHLRRKQEDLDRREAQLNGRVAQFESDSRAARLWLTENQAELKEQTAGLAEKQQEVQQCLARLAVTEKAQQRTEQELAARQTELTQAKKALDDRKTQLEERAQQLERRKAALGEWETRRASEPPPVDAEPPWAELRHQTEQLYHALCKDRREFDRQRRREQQRMVAEQRRAQSDIDRKRVELARRAEQMDRCRAALESLREEISLMHRSTLEIRLGAEELWAQLAGTAPPAALAHSLGNIRRQLAEDYREANAALVNQKQEIVALRVELSRQHELLTNEKRRLEQWLSQQEQEIQQRAARLVAREQQLDAQEAKFRDHAEQWRIDRLAYQEEIHRLRRELESAKSSV